MIRFRCSNCDKLLGIDDSEAGKWTRCVRCKQRVKIPAKSEAAPGKTSPKSQEAKPQQKQADSEGFEVIEDFDVVEEAEGAEEVEVVEEVESLEEVEDLDEIELVDEEDEEEEERRQRARRRPGKGKRRRRDEEEEEEDEEKFFTYNRIAGIGGLVVGPAFLVFGILWHFQNESVDLPIRITIMVVGGLIMLSGLYYVIKG